MGSNSGTFRPCLQTLNHLGIPFQPFFETTLCYAFLPSSFKQNSVYSVNQNLHFCLIDIACTGNQASQVDDCLWTRYRPYSLISKFSSKWNIDTLLLVLKVLNLSVSFALQVFSQASEIFKLRHKRTVCWVDLTELDSICHMLLSEKVHYQSW